MAIWLRWTCRRALGASDRHGMTENRTEAVLLAALRAAAPTGRAERSAVRANIAMLSWRGAYGEEKRSIGTSASMVVVLARAKGPGCCATSSACQASLVTPTSVLSLVHTHGPPTTTRLMTRWTRISSDITVA